MTHTSAARLTFAQAIRRGIPTRLAWARRQDRLGLVVSVLFLAAGLFAASMVSSRPMLDLVFRVLMWACLASAWNIIGGLGGQLSLGHAVFYGLGAYGTALILTHTELPTVVGVLAGGVAACALGIAVGLVGLRLKGPFFAMATFVMGVAFATLALNLAGLTGGSFGLALPIESGPWYQLVFDDPRVYVYLVTGLLAVVLLASFALRYSKMGLDLMASRSDVDAAAAMGIDVLRVRLIATVLSAFLTAMVGALDALYLLFVDPNSVFGLTVSTQIVFIALIGGLGSLAGPLLGALLVIPVQDQLSSLLAGGRAGVSGLLTGIVLLAVVLLAPSGLWGGLEWVERKLRSVRDSLLRRSHD